VSERRSRCKVSEKTSPQNAGEMRKIEAKGRARRAWPGDEGEGVKRFFL